MRDSIEDALDMLGVSGDSDPATLARAYRHLARQNHPDVSDDPDAAQRFAALSAAYRLAADHVRAHPPPRPDRSAATGLGVSRLEPQGMRQPPIVAGPVRVEPPRAAGKPAGSPGRRGGR